MTNPIQGNPKVNTSITPYVGVQGAVDERYGYDIGIEGGAKLEKALENNSTFYVDLNGSLGRNIGTNGTVGVEVPFGSRGVADFNVHAGTEFRPYAGRVDYDIEVSGKDGIPVWSEGVHDNLHLSIYEASASAGVGIKNKRVKTTVGLEGGYQGGHTIAHNNVNAKLNALRDNCITAIKEHYGTDADVKFDLPQQSYKYSGWYVGPKLGAEVKLGKNLSMESNMVVGIMDDGAICKGNIGLKYNF